MMEWQERKDEGSEEAGERREVRHLERRRKGKQERRRRREEKREEGWRE